MEFVIISGLSGAGKSRAAEFLEDMGFYTVDNMPPQLMPSFARLCLEAQERYSRVLLVCDIRAGDDFTPLLQALDLIDSMGCRCRLLYMEADIASIIMRYKETRRSHPLARDGLGLHEAARRERELLEPVRRRADLILDTTPFRNIAQLRQALAALFGEGERSAGLTVELLSFGYKYGLPLDADLIFDVRFLPNPYYFPELRSKTGLDAEILDYLDGFEETGELLSRLDGLLDFLLPQYVMEGKPGVVAGIGCTGGHHRSVAVAHRLAEHLCQAGWSVSEHHRDISR